MDFSDLPRCPVCFEDFDYDASLFSSDEEKRSSRLPTLSAKCCHKICASCLNNMQLAAMSDQTERAATKNPPKWFKCPTCKEKTAFNAVDIKIDLYACGAIATIKGLTKQVEQDKTTKRKAPIASKTKISKQKKQATNRKPKTASGNIGPSPLPRTTGTNNPPRSSTAVADQAQDQLAAAPVAMTDADGFNEEAFMKNNILLLNTFIDSKKEINMGFGPFIREGIATPGFYPVSQQVAEMNPTATYEEIRNEISRCPVYEKYGGAGQMARWLNDAKVGSFVIIRHEYNKCPFLPAKLTDAAGKYIGPVYVIGVVTKVVKIGSMEEKRIAGEKIPELDDISNTGCFRLVSWKKMGMKSSLKKGSVDYIDHAVQPTVSRALFKSGLKYKSGSTTESIRRDLWENATISISSADFPKQYDSFKEVLREKNATQYL